MAAKNPFNCHKRTAEKAVFFNSHNSVCGTCGIIPAVCREMRRNSQLIKPYQAKCDFLEQIIFFGKNRSAVDIPYFDHFNRPALEKRNSSCL